MKIDRLLYKSTALDTPANMPAEQPINSGGSQSSNNKDKDNSAVTQAENFKKRRERNKRNYLVAKGLCAKTFDRKVYG